MVMLIKKHVAIFPWNRLIKMRQANTTSSSDIYRLRRETWRVHSTCVSSFSMFGTCVMTIICATGNYNAAQGQLHASQHVLVQYLVCTFMP